MRDALAQAPVALIQAWVADMTQYTVLRKPGPRSSWGVTTHGGKHHRVNSERGKAREHTCPCGKPAKHWSNLTGNYADIYDYEAQCAACHSQYDMAWLKEMSQNEHPFTIENIRNGR